MTNNYAKKWADCAGKFTDQWEKIFAWFGKPEMTSIGLDYSDRPVTNYNLYQLIGTQNAPTTVLLQTNFVALTGWHTVVSPLVKMEALSAEFQKRIFHQSAMRPAPPESTPEFLTDSSEAWRVNLIKYQGAIEINAESLLTEDGQKYMVMKNAQAVSSMHITIKLLIGRAIIATPNEWMTLVKSNQYRSVREALEPEIGMMFIANRLPKAIYVADKYVKDYTSAFQPRFDTVIVSHGTLNALVFGNNYDTKYAEIGSNSYDRLTRGGDSLSTALPGMKFYEDEAWSIQNLEPNMIQMLRRTILMGEFSIIDGSDYGSSCDTNDYHSNQDTSISQLDVDRDSISKIDLYECVLNDIAWQYGEPNPLFQDFLRDIRGILTLTGIKIHRDQYDPWIIKTSSGMSVDGNRPNNEGLHMITVWGNQSLDYRSLAQDKKHGEVSRNRIKNVIGKDKMKKIERLQQISERLFDVTDLNEETFKAYFFAIGANPENWLEEYSSDSIYLKGDKHASPMPPYVDREPGLNNKYYDTNNRSYISDQANDLKDRGAMYVMKDGKRYYVWVLEYEDSADAQLTSAEKISWVTQPNPDPRLIRIEERSPLELQGSAAFDATKFPDWAGIDPANTRNLFDTTKPQLGGKIKGFLLAPFNAFGIVSTDGKATQWMHSFSRILTVGGWNPGNIASLSTSVDFMSNEALYLIAAKFENADFSRGDIDAKEANIKKWIKALTKNMFFKRGIKPPRLARAPIAPFGFSGINSLRTLANLSNNGSRGWDENMLNEISESVSAYDVLANHLSSDYPDCMLLNPIYAAEFMYTGNRDEDLRNIIHFNLMRNASYPIWVRVPSKVKVAINGQESDLPTLLFYSVDQNNATVAFNTVTALSDADVKLIATRMGVTNVMAGINIGDALNGVGVGVKWGDFRDALTIVVNHRDVKQSVKNALKDNKTNIGKAARMFTEYSSSRSNLGPSYVILKRDEENDKNVTTSFASFFAKEIMRLSQVSAASLKQAVSLFNMILNLSIASTQTSTGYMRDITRSLINSFKQYKEPDTSDYDDKKALEASRTARQGAASAAFTPAFANDAATAATGWINSRLMINPAVWHSLSEIFERETVEQWRAAEFYQIPIRPTNPENPIEPLGGDLIKISSSPDTSVYKDQFRQLKSARTRMRVETPNALNNTVFGDPRYFATSSAKPGSRNVRGTEYGQPNKRYRTGLGSDPFAALADYPHIISTQISSDPTGPFYNFEEYMDRDGKPLSDKTKFIREENLETRMLEVYQTVDNIFEKIPTMMFLLTRHTQRSELVWLKAGLPIPDSVYLLARIGSVQADAAIWIEAGQQTAQTGYNFPQNIVTYDGLKDKLMLRYAAYFNSWVIDPHKIFIYDAFRATGYNCGLGNTFYNNTTMFSPRNLNKQPRSINGFRCGSLWTLKNAVEQNPISIFGKYDSTMFMQNINDPQGIIFNDQQHWPSFLFYDFVLNLREMRSAITRASLSTWNELKQNECYDGLLWLRKFMKWNKATKKYDTVVGGTSALQQADVPIRAVLSGGVGLFTTIYQ